MNNDIKEKIIKIVKSVGGRVNSNGEVENLDSMTFIACIVKLEDEFNVKFPDKYLTVGRSDNLEKMIYMLQELLKNRID